jgi:NADH-quinone oxidoreductase subunit C
VNVHVPLDFNRPECPSITDVYVGAQWHERETWEMFGIDFPGHPRLVNLYLPEDFEGHPLLKSFKLPSRSVKEWPGAKDPEEATAGGR